MTVTPTRAQVFTLPPVEYYTSEQHFAEEFDNIFSQQWVFVGHVSELPHKGSYKTVDYGGEQIVVVRGDDTFHAHYNFCRHRGYRLCDQERGRVRALVCPYHQWRFDFDGTLRSVPKTRDGELFDYTDYHLRSVRVDVWNGLLFVHLGQEEPAPLTSVLAEFQDAVAYFDPARTKVARVMTWELEANWKVVVENALECYHCPGSHATFCRVVDVPALAAQLGEWLEDGDEATTSGGAQGVALKPGMQTMTPDGSPVTDKLLGSCTQADAEHGATAGMLLVPNYSYAGFYVDHWWSHSMRPLSATRTELVYMWFVRDDVDVDALDMDKLTKVGHMTTVEDNVLCEKNYEGMRSRYYTPGPLADTAEPALHDFAQNYRRFMGLTSS